MDYTTRARDVGGNRTGANSLKYLITDPDDTDNLDELSVFYSEFICRKLEDEGERIIVRHGWSSIVDHNRPNLPFGINLPDVP